METAVKEKNATVVIDYINTVGQKQFDKLDRFFTEDLEFTGPSSKTQGIEMFTKALKRLGTILLRNDIKRVFVDGDEVCIIYDFVTDTQVGAVSTVEWIKLKDGKIASIRLIFDRFKWNEVVEEINRRLKLN